MQRALCLFCYGFSSLPDAGWIFLNSLTRCSYGIPRIWLHLSILSSRMSSRIKTKMFMRPAGRDETKCLNHDFSFLASEVEIFIPRFLDLIHVLEHHLATWFRKWFIKMIRTDTIINKWMIYIRGPNIAGHDRIQKFENVFWLFF